MSDRSIERELQEVLAANRRLLDDQREANEQLVTAAIESQESMEKAEKAQERAEKSERELRSVAEFREMFMGILGHDLRNPLASIDMSVAYLRRFGDLDEHGVQALDRIVSSNRRMARMITQLLDLTRARLGGGMPVVARRADLGEVCRSVAQELGTAVRVEVRGDLIGTWDPDRLEEAISNLTGNALEFATPSTGVVIKAHDDGASVVVEVINQGEPIAADVLPFLFAPFRRGPTRAIKTIAGNLGLGLYIAHQIVISHGGTLAASSSEGTTTLRMRLPRHRQPSESPVGDHGERALP